MRVIIVRHGETNWNHEKIHQGQSNSQLNAKGIAQAKRVAKRLEKENIEVAYSSDLDRAKDTCKEILKFYPETKLVLSKEIREQSKGKWEGKHKDESAKRREEAKAQDLDWDWDGGETTKQMFDRVVKELKRIHNTPITGTVLIVCHGGPIQCMAAYLSGKDYKLEGVPTFLNCSVTSYNLDRDKFILEILNDTEHLK
jgi:broad specificity phosphatase PhoE